MNVVVQRALLVGLAAGAVAGCSSGGEPAQREVSVAAFTTLAVSDALVIDVSAGAPSCTVLGEAEYVNEVLFLARGERLEIGMREDEAVLLDLPLRVRITTSSLAAVEARDASVLHVEGVDRDRFAVTAEAGSWVDVKGQVGILALTARTTADVDTRALEAQEVEVLGASAAVMQVLARSQVRGRLTENAELTVSGGAGVDGLELLRDAELHRAP